MPQPIRTLVLRMARENPSCRVHVAGITTHPTEAWVAQQTRNLFMDLGDHAASWTSVITLPGSGF